ncbi:hypothetical protein PQJ75_17410 [Rhodoplanes sp. TEM]|uniref:Glycosyltransferase RgtA/B/C/D-like domain-containing protein n=1 Tax=Rhodoplanes tepidamans TaxID=200616 RepID=A0ABT5JCP5_RHOTP|nr:MULTISPECIES: hypothetical protein [Rhodoplanes]MDC7787392.1 hypothetical protein [Rhodoplanes tepidamans]MDC7985511.1 hypothetical protein [Rhodoplanes sp. TEM]MDQ0358122.1 hypothetical protein [Rhodoplanes tepidamans]
MLARELLAVLSLLVASVCSAALLTALRLPSDMAPLVFAALFAAAAVAFRRLPLAAAPAPLRWFEAALIGWAALTGLLRLVPYAAQSLTGRLAAAVHWDDNWHVQELASLVNSERFPPLLNYQPDTHLHFYYVAWMPAAALAEMLQRFGLPAIKLAYGIGALLLALSAATILVAFLRHVLPAERRGAALAALVVAAAVPDGVALLIRWTGGLAGTPPADWLAHAEWWQRDLGVPNQLSSLTTLLVWVPHHLIAGAALLLAGVIATEPLSLKPRPSIAAMVAAGLLVAFAAFASVFALIGGLVALSPLLVRFAARPQTLVALAAAALVSAPLAYLYLNADSAGGFRVLLIYTRWAETFGGAAAGLTGLAFAALFLTAEIGWLAWLALRPPPSPLKSPLGRCAIAATLFVASTVVIGFSGANNWAMRGAIVPVVVIATCWAAVRADAAEGALRHGSRPALAAVPILVSLAAVTHVAEMARHGRDSVAAIDFAGETEACKARIMAANAGPPGPVDPTGWDCRAIYSLYGLERPFTKRDLSQPDRELMGRGP